MNSWSHKFLATRKPNTKRKALGIGLVALTCFLSGCASVQPWQRGSLADHSMRPDRDQVETGLAEHMWFSREAATGGRGVGGGGCGCN